VWGPRAKRRPASVPRGAPWLLGKLEMCRRGNYLTRFPIMAATEHESTAEFHWQFFFERASEPVFFLSRARRVLFVNSAWESLTGWSAAQARGLLCSHRSSNASGAMTALAHALSPPRGVLQGQLGRVRRLAPTPGPTQNWWDLDFSPLQSGDSVLGILGRIQPVEGAHAVSPYLLTEKLVALRERATQRYRLDSLSSKLPAVRRLRDQARLACRLKVPLVLVGEPGSGKQWLARAIHYHSFARDRAFVRLDCRRLSAPTLNEMVFGDHGLLRRAEIGTLYLDDPGALPRELQARLTAHLAESGETTPRLIGGCAQDPVAEVHAGRLLNEFFHALGTLTLVVPPLRERRADLAPLIEHFLERAAERNGLPKSDMSRDAHDLLESYSWPNNLRELYGALATAHARAAEGIIEPSHFPASVRLAVRLQETSGARNQQPLPLDQVLEQVERRLIVLALRRHQGNKSKAAEWLGIWRPRLLRRMEALGIKENQS
jgi:transcriptional regulator with PAS, ATPase and Fis domain